MSGLKEPGEGNDGWVLRRRRHVVDTRYIAERRGIYIGSRVHTFDGWNTTRLPSPAHHAASVPTAIYHLDFEAEAPHADQMLLNELFAFFVRLGPVEFEEAVVAR